MKKIIAFVVALFAAGNLFALSGDVDFGMILGGGTCEKEDNYLFIKREVEYKTGIVGLYGNFDLMFTENFGIFNDVSYNIPFNTSLSAKIFGLSNGDDGYKSTLFVSDLLGVQGGFEINEKFRLLFGGGLDCAYLESENKSGFTYNYLSGLTYTNCEEKILMLGVGAKAKAQFFFTEKIGMNAGFVFDWYFAEYGEVKQKTLWYGTIEGSDTIYENFFFFRPELGMTIKLF